MQGAGTAKTQVFFGVTKSDPSSLRQKMQYSLLVGLCMKISEGSLLFCIISGSIALIDHCKLVVLAHVLHDLIHRHNV